jgi:hypothetical protein
MKNVGNRDMQIVLDKYCFGFIFGRGALVSTLTYYFQFSIHLQRYLDRRSKCGWKSSADVLANAGSAE